VVLSPSRLLSETPFRPRWAVQGPSTPNQQSPDFRQRRSEPAVERPLAATTVISWVAEPVSASWFARFATHVEVRASLLPLPTEQSNTKAKRAIPQRIPPGEYARRRDEDADARDLRGGVVARAAFQPQRLAGDRGAAAALVASGLSGLARAPAAPAAVLLGLRPAHTHGLAGRQR